MQQLHVQLANNQAKMATRGLSMESPTFNAIQMDTFNKTAQALQTGTTAMKIDRLNEKSELNSIEKIRKDKQNSIFFQGIGQLASLGAGAYKI